VRVMNTTTLIIVIVIIAVVVIVAIIAFAMTAGRRRKAEADRQRASELRQSAADDGLAAKEREAKAARAAADAQQAEVDAQRLRQEADARQDDAASARAASEEKLRKADGIDPDVDRRTAQHTDADGRDGAPPTAPRDSRSRRRSVDRAMQKEETSVRGLVRSLAVAFYVLVEYRENAAIQFDDILRRQVQ